MLSKTRTKLGYKDNHISALDTFESSHSHSPDQVLCRLLTADATRPVFWLETALAELLLELCSLYY